MAIVSSHLLSSTDGSHASGVKVIINQINKNGSRRKMFQSKTDKNGPKISSCAIVISGLTSE